MVHQLALEPYTIASRLRREPDSVAPVSDAGVVLSANLPVSPKMIMKITKKMTHA